MSKKPRRKRWTVRFVDGGEPEVILAHSSLDASWFYTSCKGRLVASVTEGDYRALSRAPSGAKPIRDNVAEAMAFLGVECEVEIKMTNRAQFQRGMCRATPAHPFLLVKAGKVYGGEHVLCADATWKHMIHLAASQEAKEMGETLWHELAHAMQFERDILRHEEGTVREALRRWHTMYRDGTAYADKPYEVEANDYMQHNKELPLAR